MSAGGWGGYSVHAAELAERRRRSAAVDRRARLAKRQRELAAKAKARRARSVALVDVTVTTSVGEITDNSSIDHIEAWNSEMDRELERVEARLVRAEQEDSRAQLAQHLAEIADSEAIAGLKARAEAERMARAVRPAEAHSSRPTDPHMTNAPDTPAQDVAEVVATIVADARPAATSREQDELEKLAETVVGDASNAQLRLRELKLLASRVMRAAQERVQAAKQAQRLRDTLDGLPGAAVQRARVLLDEVVAGESGLVSSDVERIERIRAEAEAEVERTFVAEQLTEAFRRAGCDVQQGFATDVLSGSPGYVRMPDSPEHAVEVELDEGGFTWRTVRASGQPDADADTGAQHLTCRTLGVVSANAYEGGGVRIRLREPTPPGEMAVEHVPAAQQALSQPAVIAEPIARRLEG